MVDDAAMPPESETPEPGRISRRDFLDGVAITAAGLAVPRLLLS